MSTITNSVTCSGCAKEATAKKTSKGIRVPKGWKRRGQETYCAECWSKLYRLRAVIFPVAEVLDGEWKDFTSALRDCWGRSTALANWAVTELAKADIVRKSTDVKMPSMPAINLYQLWQNHHQRSEWIGAAQSANAVLHSVEQKYRKVRLEVIWSGAAVLPRHRYPVPFPAHNAAWTAAYQEYVGKDEQISKVPTISVPLGMKRWILRLRGGNERRRQLAAFAQIVSGEAIQGELSLYRVRSSSSSHRSRMAETHSGGGVPISYRIMCKLVAWLPRPQVEKSREGTLEVRTGSNALWIALAPEREDPWILHANYVRRWIKVHRWKLDQISDDTKAERRRPKRNRRQTNEHLDKLTTKQHRRLDSFCQRATAMLVAFAGRCQVAEISYDDSNRRYFPIEFPWYRLRELLQQKAEEVGLGFRIASGKVIAEKDGGTSAEV